MGPGPHWKCRRGGWGVEAELRVGGRGVVTRTGRRGNVPVGPTVERRWVRRRLTGVRGVPDEKGPVGPRSWKRDTVWREWTENFPQGRWKGSPTSSPGPGVGTTMSSGWTPWITPQGHLWLRLRPSESVGTVGRTSRDRVPTVVSLYGTRPPSTEYFIRAGPAWHTLKVPVPYLW